MKNWAKLIKRSVPRTVPPKAHRLVKALLTKMRQEKVTYGTLGDRAGTSPFTIFKWRRGVYPDLREIEACLNVMELEITTVALDHFHTSRQIARESGAKTYIGNPCSKCNGTARYVANNHCTDCLRLQRRKRANLEI